jgi:exodeoxyribonuclease-3
MTVKFMTWNIKTGAVDRGRGDRLDAVIAVIARERPDLLALQELRDFRRDGAGRLHALADAVAMTPHLAPSVLGQPVAVLVRPPGRFASTAAARWPLYHAAAVGTVPTDRGPLTVVSTHLNPLLPQVRMREARWLATRYGPEPSRFGRGRGWTDAVGSRVQRLVLLAGDLNALDPWSDHADRLARLPEQYRKRHLRRDGSVDTRTIATLEAAGLVDLWRTAGSGDGLTAPTTQGGGEEFSGMRLDYVLGSPPLAGLAAGCRVVRGGEAEYASDHYPVVADLDLTLSG